MYRVRNFRIDDPKYISVKGTYDKIGNMIGKVDDISSFSKVVLEDEVLGSLAGRAVVGNQECNGDIDRRQEEIDRSIIIVFHEKVQDIDGLVSVMKEFTKENVFGNKKWSVGRYFRGIVRLAGEGLSGNEEIVCNKNSLCIRLYGPGIEAKDLFMIVRNKLGRLNLKHKSFIVRNGLDKNYCSLDIFEWQELDGNKDIVDRNSVDGDNVEK